MIILKMTELREFILMSIKMWVMESFIKANGIKRIH